MDTGLSSAYVLHRRAYRESSLLVEVLSEHQGRVALVARGAARGARKGCALEPFIRLRLSWAGRGELHTLTGCETGRAFGIGRDRLAFGLYGNELLLKLLPRDAPATEAYVAYEQWLNDLILLDPWTAVLNLELSLLDVLGHPLAAAAEGWCADIDPGECFTYRLHEGFTRGGGPASGATITGRALTTMARGTAMTGSARRELLGLSQDLINRILGGRSLETRRLLPPRS